MASAELPVTGVPCLLVDDVEVAAGYYRNVLSFEQVALLGGAQPRFAIMRKHGAAVLLQQSPPRPGRSPAGSGGPPWDAIFLVDDVEGEHHQLKVRGVDSLGEIGGNGIGWDSFDFRDCCGNLICIGQSADQFLATVRPAPPGRIDRLRERRQRQLAQREERRLLREFREFHGRLADKHDVYYMFFTEDLLHWVIKAESFVPADVNLVLIGAGLAPDEQRWLAEHMRRPFHHIALPVDDVTVWEFLFAVSGENFGWLDIDCFVLNQGLFAELAQVDPRAALNCVWSWDSGYGFRVANTHFMFVNAAAISAVQQRGVAASPSTYDWHGSVRRFPPRRCFMSVPSAAQRALLLEVLPADPEGRPRLLEGDYFNTLVVYQLLARAVGYPVAEIRSLARRCRAPSDADSTDPEDWPEDMSDELFHLYGISYYKSHDYEPGIRGLYLAAEYVMLDNAAALLPARYAGQLTSVAAELEVVGLRPDEARDRLRRHLTDSRGLGAAAAERVLEPLPAAGPRAVVG
jgi:hypothetical protein